MLPRGGYDNALSVHWSIANNVQLENSVQGQVWERKKFNAYKKKI